MKKFLSVLFILLMMVSPVMAQDMGDGAFKPINATPGGIVNVGASTADLVNAVATAPANSTLMLSSGTYTVTSAIAVTKALNIVGQGSTNGTNIVSTTNGLILFNVTSDNVTIKNLKVTYTAQGNMRIFYFNAQGTTVFNNIKLENINATILNSVSGYGVVADYADAGGEIRNCNFSATTSLNTGTIGTVQTVNFHTAEAPTILNIFNSKITAIGGSLLANAIKSAESSASQDMTTNVYNTTAIATRISGTVAYALSCNGGANGILNVYGGYASGQDYDANNVAGGNTLTIAGTTLANNLTSGTITYAGTLASVGLKITTSIVAGANTACTTTCGARPCLAGQDTTSLLLLACSDATADSCLCA